MSYKTCSRLVLSALVVGLLAAAAVAAPIDLPADIDTRISSQAGSRDGSQPDTGSIDVKRASSGDIYDRFMLVRFDLSGLSVLSSAADIQSATVKFHESYILGHTATFTFNRVLTDWEENASWNNAKPDTPTTWSGGAFSSADYGAPALGTWQSPYGGSGQPAGYNMTLDVTDLVKDWFDNPTSNYGIVIRATGGWWPQANINSSEAASDKPIIEVIPEPATLALLGVGGIGVLLRNRR